MRVEACSAMLARTVRTLLDVFAASGPLEAQRTGALKFVGIWKDGTSSTILAWRRCA